jgi:hypothetical protein
MAHDDTSQKPVRHRVVLVRWPRNGPRELRRVLPRGALPKRDALPVVVRVTTDAERALETALRISEAGAGVVLMAEYSDLPVVCIDHPPELVRGSCRRCGRHVCSGCLLEADGDRLCPPCAREGRARVQRIHTRQLFVVFLFCAFLYQIYDLWIRDNDIREGAEQATVAVLQFVPEGQYEHPLVRGLSGLDPLHWEGPVYSDVVSFFERERQRYTGQLVSNLRLSVRGPWVGPPAAPDLDAGPGGALRQSLAALRYSWFWRKLAENHGVDGKRFPLRMFVIFTARAGDQAAMSRASLGGNLAVTYVSLDDPNPAYPAITIAHELAHLLGASDKYGGDGLARYPEGYVEPFLEPLYPQRFGELMAVDIPVGRKLEAEPQSLDQLRIGYRSAAEMRWVADDQAEAFYRSSSLSPEMLLELQVAEDQGRD